MPITQNIITVPGFESSQTTQTATTDPENAWMPGVLLPFGRARRVYLTQNATSTVQVGQPLFVVAGTTNVVASGPVLVVEPFITASNIGNSVVGFAGQTARGNAMIWMQQSGCGTIMVRGTGATASCSGGQLVAFNSDTGFVVTGAVWASTAAPIWGRIMATNAVNAKSVTTISSASTDTVTLQVLICGTRGVEF